MSTPTQINRNDSLIIASNQGDYQRVKSLLKSKADIEAMYASAISSAPWIPNNATPLETAARKGHTRVIELLLNKKADIARRDSNGWTVLSSAVAGSQPEAVRLLLNRKADPNARGYRNRTALMLASCHQRPDITKLLVEAKGDIHLQDDSGDTALMDAIDNRTENAALRELLTTYKADPNLPNKEGSTPLIKAVNRKCLDAIPILIEEKADIAHVDNRGMTALTWAALQKDSGLSAALLLESLQLQEPVSEAPSRRKREEPTPQVFAKRLRSQQNKE